MQRRIDERLIYEKWMEQEGIPIYRGLAGADDVADLPRRPWARLGGSGTFIELEGTRQTGMLIYVVEIPAGGALEPEKHLYDELMYILRGRGLTEVWQEGQGKSTFEWGEGSLFAMPTNVWHRMVNGGRQPVVILAKTNLPTLMATFRSADFIFNCDYKFTDRYTGQTDYFLASENRYQQGPYIIWETNFVPDMRSTMFEEPEMKGRVGREMQFRMSNWSFIHAGEWPVGKYRTAHHHAPGAVFIVLQSEGYSLIWPSNYGIHPYQDGHGDEVVKAGWKAGGIYALFGYDSFHQHFNTGPKPTKRIVLTDPVMPFNKFKTWKKSVREGGNKIEYEDEDPEVRRIFEEELRKNGVKSTMKPVVYNTEPIPYLPPIEEKDAASAEWR